MLGPYIISATPVAVRSLLNTRRLLTRHTDTWLFYLRSVSEQARLLLAAIRWRGALSLLRSDITWSDHTASINRTARPVKSSFRSFAEKFHLPEVVIHRRANRSARPVKLGKQAVPGKVRGRQATLEPKSYGESGGDGLAWPSAASVWAASLASRACSRFNGR